MLLRHSECVSDSLHTDTRGQVVGSDVCIGCSRLRGRDDSGVRAHGGLLFRSRHDGSVRNLGGLVRRKSLCDL